MNGPSSSAAKTMETNAMRHCAGQLERALASLGDGVERAHVHAVIARLVCAPMPMTAALLAQAHPGDGLAPQVIIAALIGRLYGGASGRFVRWEAEKRFCAATLAIVEQDTERHVGVLLLEAVSKGGAILWAARELERKTFGPDVAAAELDVDETDVDELEVVVAGIGDEIHDEPLLTRLLADPRLLASPCRRLTLTWLAPSGVRHRTWERVGTLPFHRNALLTNVHPENARELGVWRLREFSLRQLQVDPPLIAYSGRPRVPSREQTVFVFSHVDAVTANGDDGIAPVALGVRALADELQDATPADEPPRAMALSVVVRGTVQSTVEPPEQSPTQAPVDARTAWPTLESLRALSADLRQLVSVTVTCWPAAATSSGDAGPVTLSLTKHGLWSARPLETTFHT